MIIPKKIYVTFIILLPFIVGFVNSTSTSFVPHPYTWRFDTLKIRPPEIPADNLMTEEGVKLGRLLFYDTLLSFNNKQSCGSCHKQEYSFTDGKKLAIGAFGDTLERNTLTLVNLAWSKQFFWDGRIKNLEDLIPIPLYTKKEMGETEERLLSKLNAHAYYPGLFEKAFGSKQITTPLISKAIAQFLRTIVSNPIHLPDSVLNIPPKGISEIDFTTNNMNKPTTRGFYFRFASMCGTCHNNDAYGFYDGLAFNRVNNEKNLMKIPPLVNILYTAPYMHDGRFNTIEEVIDHYDKHIDSLLALNPQLDLPLKYKGKPEKNLITEYDKKNAIYFFNLLRDTALLTNKEFANPFLEIPFDWNK